MSKDGECKYCNQRKSEYNRAEQIKEIQHELELLEEIKAMRCDNETTLATCKERQQVLLKKLGGLL